MTDQPMNPIDLDSAIVVARRVAVMLGRHATATRLTITATGLDVAVSCDDAAGRIVEPNPFRRASHSLVQVWVGVIGETPVTVRVVDAIPSPRPTAERQKAGVA